MTQNYGEVNKKKLWLVAGMEPFSLILLIDWNGTLFERPLSMTSDQYIHAYNIFAHIFLY